MLVVMEENESLLSLLYLEKIKEWAQKNRLLLFLIFSGALLSIILLYKAANKTKENVLAAEKSYQLFLKEKDESSMRKLIALALKDKTVALHYDLPISLYFLQHHQIEEARPFMERSQNRLQEISPYHETYGKGTNSILSSDWGTALQSAMLLRGQFTESEEAKKRYPSLYNSNLLRIALLYKKLQNQPAELAAWQELKSSPNHTFWIESLHQNGVAMQEFISDRISELSQK